MDTTQICSICNNQSNGGQEWRNLQEKAKKTLIDSSIKRKDNKFKSIDVDKDVFTHNSCYKSYTRQSNIENALKPKNNDAIDNAPRKQRAAFDYKTHCLICAKEFEFEAEKRHLGRSTIREVISVK